MPKATRALMNVIENAVSNMQLTRAIWFETFDERDFIVINIKYRGHHIQDDELDRLFEPFKSDTRHEPGIGLAISRKIVEAHNGKISCTSHPTKGIEFQITFPRAKSNSNETIPVFASSKEIPNMNVSSQAKNEEKITDRVGKILNQNQHLKILIVDDDEICSKILESHMRSSGIQSLITTFSASNSREALDLCQSNAFDLIIIDIDMGIESLNGLETARNIRSIMPSSFICIHTNRSGSEIAKKAFEHGADRFLTKSMTMDQLLFLVEQSIAIRPHTKKKEKNNHLIGKNQSMKKIIVIDDEAFVHNMWSLELEPSSLISLQSMEEVQDFVEKSRKTMEKCGAIIIDYQLNSGFNGFDVADYLLERGIQVPMFLSTNDLFLDIAGTPFRKKLCPPFFFAFKRRSF